MYDYNEGWLLKYLCLQSNGRDFFKLKICPREEAFDYYTEHYKREESRGL